METKEEISKNLDDEQMYKKIEQHNRNVNVVVSLSIVAMMLIGVMATRMYLMTANAQEVKSEIEMKFEDDVKRFKQEIATVGEGFKPSRVDSNLQTGGVEALPYETKQSNYNQSSANSKFVYKENRVPVETWRAASPYKDLHVDINTADTAELRKLPGIGEKRALNIVKFRTSLGGFYSVEQLAEVYSMDAELVERLKKYIVCDGSSVAKIDINNTNPYKLWHPYLKGDLLKTLKQRIKSGKRYKSFDEIKAETGYDENLNGRAERYLEFK